MTQRQHFFTKSSPAYAQVSHPCYSRKVGIIGAGGLGSNLTVILLRMGFTNIIVADFDRIEPSNLNRQIYGFRQIGKPKVEALAEIVETLLPEIRIRTHLERIDDQNMKHCFAGCSVIADCTDLAQNKSHIVETALLQLACSVVTASGIGGRLVLDKLNCHRRFGNRLWIIGDQRTSDSAGVAAPMVTAAACAMAEAVYEICRMQEDEL